MKKSLIAVLSALAGGMTGTCITRRIAEKEYTKLGEMSDKHLNLFLMMNRWVRIKQDGKSLVAYFERNGFYRIAVYGMSFAGETFLAELKGTGIEVVYGIDRNADVIFTTIDVFSVDESLEEVDAVVVTAITCFREIESELRTKLKCPILSLADIILREEDSE